MSGYTETIFSQSMAGFFHESKSAILDNRLRQDLVSKSRVLLTKVPLAKAIIDVLTRGVVGSGLHPDCESAHLFDIVSAAHALDAQKALDFCQMQQQIWQTALSCGECFLIRQRERDDGFSSWLAVEPDHVRNPPSITAIQGRVLTYKGHILIDGIEFKNDGTPYAIHYCINPYIGNSFDKKNWRRIFFFDTEGVQNVIHVRLLDRPEYPRGLPVLAPLIETLYGLYAFQAAQIQMGIVQSCQAFVVKTEEAEKSLNPLSSLTRQDLHAPLIPKEPESHKEAEKREFSIIPPANRNFDGTVSNANFVAPGQSYHLGINESIEHLSTTGPSNSLTEYYDLVLAQCASALGIPKAILSNIFDTSFSSCKASIAQWNFTISRFRKMFITQCLMPVYDVFLRECFVDMDAVDRSEVLLKMTWKCQDPPLFADESKTLKFYADAIELGLITRDEAAQALFGHAAEGVGVVEQNAE